MSSGTSRQVSSDAEASDSSADIARVENALLLKVAAGDLGAPLEDLYTRYERRLYNLGLKLLGNPGLAEELVQETFLRVWRAAGRFDPERGSAGAFIYGIARNMAVDLYRRPSSRPNDDLPEHGSVDDHVDSVLTGLTVRAAMNEISATHREVLEALYGRGERAVEVADRLGVPAATIRTRSFHGLRALSDVLHRMGVDVA